MPHVQRRLAARRLAAKTSPITLNVDFSLDTDQQTARKIVLRWGLDGVMCIWPVMIYVNAADNRKLEYIGAV